MTDPQRRLLEFAVAAIAAGLAAVALLAPLTGGPIEYHVAETLRNQTIGLDAASLFVVAPVALAAALLVRRGHVAGPAIALGLGAYTAYMLVQYIVGPEYLARPGNNELLFPLYLCLFVLGWGSALVAWAGTGSGAHAARAASPGRAREGRAAATGVPRFLSLRARARRRNGRRSRGRRIPGRSDVLGRSRCSTSGSSFPPRSPRASGSCGPAIAIYVNDDPNASAGNAAFMTVLGLAFAVLALTVYRSLFGRPSNRSSATDHASENATRHEAQSSPYR